MQKSAQTKHWYQKIVSVAAPLKGQRKRERAALHARTERRLADVKKRCGAAFLAMMETIDLTSLPAFIQTGRKRPADRDLNIIGAVMDTHLGLGGFYVQSTDVLFLFKAPEVGAAPLRQAILDELNVKLMPAMTFETELTKHQLAEQFGADVMKYVHTIDLKGLLFPDNTELQTVPSVVRDIARMTLDKELADCGHFAATDKNTFAVLFSTPSPDFARQHMERLREAIQGRAANLATTYALHLENEHHPEHHATAHDGGDPKIKGKGLSSGVYEPKATKARNDEISQAEQKWYAAFTSTIGEAARSHETYLDRLAHLPWDQGITYEPILRRRTSNIVGRFCRPAKPVSSKAFPPTERHTWAALPDVPLAKDLVDHLQTGQCCKSPEIICLPIHYHTIANHVCREALLNYLTHLPKQSQHYISAELVGFDASVAPFVINDYIRMLKPHFRTVLIQADVDGKLLEHYAGLPVHAAGLDLDFPGLNEEERLKRIRTFAERSHFFFRRIYIRSASSKAQVQEAIHEDYSYISGSVLQPAGANNAA